MLGNTSVAFDAGAASGETDVVLPVALSAGAWGVCWSPDDGATFYVLPEVLEERIFIELMTSDRKQRELEMKDLRDLKDFDDTGGARTSVSFL